jgi:monoamine oxidase
MVVRMATGSFDDGALEVPTGRAGRVERVVVIGAGIAGLTVANALAHAGVECVVLEARDRPGGRLYTVDLAGATVDLGGSWIHHPDGNPLRRLAELGAVGCRPGNPLERLGAFDVGEHRSPGSVELAALLAHQEEGFPAWVEGRRAATPPATTAAQAIEAYVGEAGLPAAEARRLRQALRAAVEADAADRAPRQSLRWLWAEDEYAGDYFGDLPRHGYREIVAFLGRGLDVRLETSVEGVRVAEGGVRVVLADRTEVTASHAVVTVPLGVLQDGRPRFDPPLDGHRRAAVHRLGFGRYEKVVLVHDDAFWRGRGRSHQVLFPQDPDLSAVWVFDLDAFGQGPALACHLFHGTADVLLAGPPDAGVRRARELVETAYGPGPPPVATAVTDWAGDPWARGAYTHLPPGSAPVDCLTLAEPHLGRVLFAGEHTRPERLGYADGAMSSGIREAKRLLGAEAVELGPLGPAREAGSAAGEGRRGYWRA